MTSETRNERRNSILMTCYYTDMGSASGWSCRVRNLLQPIRITTEIWVFTRHQYRFSALVSQTSFLVETSDGITKCLLFSEAISRPWAVVFLSLEPLATSERVKLCIKKLLVKRRKKDWSSVLVPGALPSLACSRSAVTKKKNERLLSVYSFSKNWFYIGKAPGDSGKGKN